MAIEGLLPIEEASAEGFVEFFIAGIIDPVDFYAVTTAVGKLDVGPTGRSLHLPFSDRGCCFTLRIILIRGERVAAVSTAAGREIMGR